MVQRNRRTLIQTCRLASCFALPMISFSAACSRREPAQSEIVRPAKMMIVAAGSGLDTRTFREESTLHDRLSLPFRFRAC